VSTAIPKPLRIDAFSAIDLSLPQGHALHVRGLFDALCARGHEVVLITPRPVGERPPVLFRTIEAPVVRWRVLGPWSFELLGGLRLFLRCFRRRPDLLYARQDLYTLAPASVARILSIPLAVEVDASIPEELALSARPSARRLAAFCERFSLRRASVVLVLAEEHGRAVASRLGIDPGRFRPVPIGARIPQTTDPIRTRAEHFVNPGTFLVGFAGNLAPIQGVDRLVDAFERLSPRSADLWIIGTGTQEVELRARAAPLGARVRFFGGVTREEADRLQQACQLLVAPYPRNAYLRVSGGGALSSKVLAYLANDRPVLISDMPGYAWLEEIGAGERFAPDDAAGLARAIEAWEQRWRAAGEPLTGWPWTGPGPGWRFVEQGHTWDDAAARTESILREIKGSGREGAPATGAGPPGR
jgi:glycosyltransferase involved in cell wall biosynthesis